MKWLVFCDIVEHHERVIEAVDADDAQDILCEEALQRYGRVERKVDFRHAVPVEKEAETK